MRRAAWLTAANVVAFSLSFLAPLLLVRALNQTSFGVYKQAFQILTSALAWLNLQVSSTAYYFMPRAPGKKFQVAFNIIVFYAAVGALLASLFIVYPQCALLVFKGGEIVPYMPLLGVTILLWLVSSNLEIIPLAIGDVRTSAVFIVVAQLTKSALTISAALIFHSIKAIIIAAAIQGLLQIVIMFTYLSRRFRSQLGGFDWELFKAQISNALPYGMGSFAQSTQGDLHNFMVWRYFPPAGYAVYSIGLFQLPLLGLLTDSFRNALIPEVSHLAATGDRRAIIPVWLNAIRKLALAICPICALMFVLRYEIITLLFTTAYESAVPIFGIYLFSALIPVTLTSAPVRAIEDFKFFRFKLHLALVPVSLVALYVGIHLAGLVGSVSALVAVQMVEVAVAVTVIGRRLGFVTADLRRLTPAMKTLFAVLIAAFAAFAVKLPLGHAHLRLNPSANTLFKMALCSVVFGLVYVIAAYTMGAVTDEEKAEFRATLSRFLQSGSRARQLIIGQ